MAHRSSHGHRIFHPFIRISLLGLWMMGSLLAVGCGGGSGITNTPPPPTATLTASVTAQGNFSNGEQNATYSIGVSNTGSVATSGTVTVADPPTGFTITAIAGTGWTCTVSSGTCTRSDALSAGQSYPTITVTGNVTSPNGTPVSIPLNVSGGGLSAPVTSTPTVTVAAPALTITSSHSGNFNLGQQGAYTAFVKNGTSAGATNAKVTVTENVPAGETLASMSGTGWTCPGSGGASTCDRSDTLVTGGSYPGVTVVVNVAANAGSSQVNQATVSGGGSASSSAPGDSTTINTPDLVITKSHAGSFTAGANGTFNIAVSNVATGATAGPTGGPITVTDALASQFTFVSGTATGWSCNASGQTVTCTNPGPINAGASAITIPLVVAVSSSASGTVNNTATVVAFGDANTANNSSTDSVSVTSTAPDLSITKSHTGTFAAGTNGTFSIAVKNAGTGPTTGPITVTDVLASQFTFVSGTAAGWTCSASGQTVTCTNAGPISAGASATTIPLVVAASISASGSVNNIATVTTAGDSNSTNNSSTDSVSVTAAPPDLSITKSHTGTFAAGTNGTFNIAISNVGTGATTGTITVTDTLAPAFTFVSGTASGWSCGASGQNVTCTNPGPINPGSSAATIPLLVAINSSASGSVSNTAVVTTANDSNAANNSSTDTVTIVLPPPDFSISVSQPSVSAEAGTTSTPITVSVTALNGFSGAVSVNVPGLPAGVSCSPACPLTVSAGTPAQVSFVVPASAIVTSSALTVQGTSGSLNHSKPLTLNVTTSLQGLWNFWQNDALVSQNPASITGKTFVSGWGFEKIPVTAVSVLVDNSSIGNAFYGTQRPGLNIAGAPEDCGFSLALDTTALTNGIHTVSVNVTDSVGNVVAMENYPNNLPSIQINVNNPPSTATGPVANLTLNAPTTLLTVGTIVQFTASATDGSGNPVSPSFAWSSTAPTIVKVNPAGDLFPLAVGTTTISVSAGGKTQQVGVNVQAGSVTPGSIQVSIGPPEVVFNYNRDACREGDVPDNPARAVRLNDGSLLMIAGSPPYFATFGADFYSLKRNCNNPILVSADSTVANTFANMQWIFSVYNDGSTIHALIHNEFHDPIATTCVLGDTTDSNPCQYNSITYATSTDGGHSFTMAAAPQNLVAPPPMQWTPPAPGQSPFYWGYQEPTNIVHAADGFYYARFGAFTPPPNVSGLDCAIRTTALSDPSSWRAWNGTSFQLQMTDPYTNPPTSFCTNTPTNVTVPYESFTFNTYLSQFMLVGLDGDFSSNGTPINCGFHFALSSDTVNWSAQQLIASAYVPAPSGCQKPGAGGLAGSFAYGSMIDPDDTTTNFENPGRTGYIYFTRFNDNVEDRDLVRVAVMFTKQ